MKCKNCTMDCHYRTSDGEKECEFQNHIIQVPDEWRYIRIQAAIAAMQGLLCAPSYKADRGKLNMIAKDAISIADVLINELKEK